MVPGLQAEVLYSFINHFISLIIRIILKIFLIKGINQISCVVLMDDGLEESIDKIILKHAGMIGRKKAYSILIGYRGLSMRTNATDVLSGKFQDGTIIDIEDYIERIFSKKRFEKDGEERFLRTMIMGNKPNSIRIVLWGKHADLIDLLSVERRDKVLATNLKLTNRNGITELSSTSSTSFSRIVPSNTGISDFSSLAESGDRYVDVIGKVSSLGPIRYFVNLNGSQSGVSDCTLTDGRSEIRLVLWGDSSRSSADMHPGDYIKVESALIKRSEQGIELHSNDLSRILISASLKGRVKSAGN